MVEETDGITKMANKITAQSVIRSHTDDIIFNDKMKYGRRSFKIGYPGTGVEADYMAIVKELNELGFVATLHKYTRGPGWRTGAPSSSYTYTTYRIHVNRPFVVV